MLYYPQHTPIRPPMHEKEKKRYIMREFFGVGGYQRVPEGAWSWQHLLFVSSLMAVMIGLAVFLGLRLRKKDDAAKNRVMIFTAITLLCVEAFKYISFGVKGHLEGEYDWWTRELPLFLCSIQLFTIPLAGFSRGRVKEASMDFVMIFGILGAVLGTFGATQNYDAYPVISFNNVVSGLTHSIAGFASLYIMISGLGRLRWKNLWITCTILFAVCAMALTANELLDYNYMFLRSHDGTPYVLLYDLVGGNQLLYSIGVVVLFVIYIGLFYGTYHLITRGAKRKATV